MNRKGFIDFNTRLSPENSGKADSYARAIQILDEVLPYQNTIDLHGLSLYEVNNIGYENDDRELKVTDLYFKYDINELDKLSDYMMKYDTEDVIEHSKTLCKKKK